VRKTSAVLASLSLAALALTGCSVTASSADASCDRDGHANGIDSAVTVTGDVGSEPEVEIFAPVRLTETSYADVVTGESTRASTIGSWATQSPGLADAMECATGGTRIVAGLTPEDFGEANLSGFGMGQDDIAVFVIDVVDAFLPKAEGTLQFNDAKGMPTVVRADDGTPGIIIPFASLNCRVPSAFGRKASTTAPQASSSPTAQPRTSRSSRR
jgi:hypothetical protein